jgi:beta-lactamase class A
MWYKSPYPWVILFVGSAIAFVIGLSIPTPDVFKQPQPLRLSGYQFISPLLSCNLVSSGLFPEDQTVHQSIEQAVDAQIKAGTFSKASVYFSDFKTGKWASVYPDDKYYPSSLGKIPIMMAYYEMAAQDPTVLDKEIMYTGGPDLNDMQDIPPAQAIVVGQTYTVSQLIGYMIEDSDNNAAQLLYANVDQSDLNNIYSELGIPTDEDVTAANADIATPQQIGSLFRILYNATYITHDYSEEALNLMSQSSFTQGIVAGVPAGTTVSHKLGLVGIGNGDPAPEHELHDCGIVYGPDTYLICVMTRGSAPLTTMEAGVASISRAVYQQVENGK